MEALARDDLTHALAQMMGFYGKKLDQTAVRFWFNAFHGRDPELLKQAMLDYTKTGRYAPKPVDILEVLDTNRSRDESRKPPIEHTHTPCPAHIERAWRWFIPMSASGSRNFDGVLEYDVGDVDPDQQEEYLRIVNEQARQYGTPEAIPDEFKLWEVWR